MGKLKQAGLVCAGVLGGILISLQFSAMAEKEVRASLPIEEVARALELSVRTLRRRLEEAGTSFREVSDRLRAQAAQRLLHEQGLTVAEASRQLGFSDVRAFRRAFKRWLGQVPGEVRRAGGSG